MELRFLTNHSQAHQPSHTGLPRDLQNLLFEAQQRHYEELYEKNGVKTAPLENILETILESFCSLDESICHPRYIWMAVLLSLAVEPTVQAYLQHDERPSIVINSMLMQLKQALLKPSQPKEVLNQKICLPDMIETLFPRLSEGCQALDESIDVFRNCLKVLDQNQSKAALLNILDNCFEGYAIFPGASGRRELFDWWINEVIPATWYFKLPRYFYTIKGTQTFEAIVKDFSSEEQDSALL